MHELLRDLLADTHPAPALALFPLDGGALVAAFGARRLRWLVKTAEGAFATRRLRAEASALTTLAGCAGPLQIPRLLAFRESAAADRACLAQTGLPGRPMPRRWAARSALSAPERAAFAWLLQFQARAPLPASPVPASLSGLVARTRELVATDLRLDPQLAPCLQWIPAVLSTCSSLAPPVPVHRDFWPGNVLWSRSSSSIAVVDWSGFDAGSALEDPFNWFSYPGRSPGRLDTILHPGPARSFLLAWAARVGYDDDAVRCAFYLFLARRIRWELGLDLQARSPAEIAQVRPQWSAALQLLARLNFPTPLSPLCTALP